MEPAQELYADRRPIDNGHPPNSRARWRVLPIAASAAERHIADATVVYADHGNSRGMEIGIEDAKLANEPIE